jgi:hypothetical protein
MDTVSAQSAALRVMTGSVMGQSMVLSFDHIFILGRAVPARPAAAVFLRMPKQEKPSALGKCTWRCN